MKAMNVRGNVSFSMVAALLWTSSFAHHAQAPFFDQDRTIDVQGTVQRFDFRNPHPVIYLASDVNDGEEVVWQVQLAPATWLAKRGWSSMTFVPGDEITVTGHPSRQPGTYGLQSQSITRADGRRIAAPSERTDQR